MQCPKCNGEMVRVTVSGTTVDQCVKCFGIWFDFGELEEVLEASDAEALKHPPQTDENLDRKQAPCPRCHGTGNMVPLKRMGHDFHIDTCPVCYGKWLDDGELDKLKATGFFDDTKRLFEHLFLGKHV